jgi:hypothetical protein
MPRLTRPPSTGGYDFLVDPAERADNAAVFWRAEVDASVVRITTSPATGDVLRFAPNEWGGDVTRRDAADGTHILILDAGIRHQLWFPDHPIDGAAMSLSAPLDPTLQVRTEAALRFWRYATYGRRRSPPPRSTKLDRLTPTLRALDGHLDGANYRMIADALFDPARVAADAWKTSPLRATVIRLVENGMALMQGRYRDLLRPRRQRRD